MAVPVYTAIRQVPPNLFDASADLGAGSWRTIASVVLPIIKPALNRRSVFTFSLSLGDYLVARFVGGDTQMIGSVIASNINPEPPAGGRVLAGTHRVRRHLPGERAAHRRTGKDVSRAC